MTINRKRKAPLVQWVIVYHGPEQSLVTGDMRPIWDTQEAAAQAVIRHNVDIENYEVVKFERAY